MLSPLRNRFGIPGVISVVALVFAMLGGAYAASKSDEGKATASAKKAKKGPRGPKGATGPAGAQGPAGPAGTKGDKGDPGTEQGPQGPPGSPGADGQGVSSVLEAPGGNCTASGYKITTTSGEMYVCNGANGTIGVDGAPGPPGANGKDGSPWTAGGTLPKGATETGMWAATASAGSDDEVSDIAPISFGVPLASDLDESHVLYIPSNNNPDPTHCPGSSGEPKAASGYLCVYEITLTPGMSLFTITNSEFAPGADASGALVLFSTTVDAQYAAGSWAVTG